MEVIRHLPAHHIVLALLVVTMIAFYATSFDSITLVACQYSYKEQNEGKEPGKRMKLFWAVLLILLPLAFLYGEGSMANMQTVSIIAAFPTGIVIVLIIVSFIRDARAYLNTGAKDIQDENSQNDRRQGDTDRHG